MTDLSREYSTPLLEPHLTLYGRIVGEEAEICAKTKNIAELISPFPIHFTEFVQRDDFFRSIFMKAARTADLERAYQSADASLKPFLHSKYQRREFIPHLSLMYGALPGEEKRRIIASLDRALLAPFTADVVSLYRLVQEPAEWIKVNDFSLGL